jgi:hypothetical protein
LEEGGIFHTFIQYVCLMAQISRLSTFCDPAAVQSS